MFIVDLLYGLLCRAKVCLLLEGWGSYRSELFIAFERVEILLALRELEKFGSIRNLLLPKYLVLPYITSHCACEPLS